MIQKKLFFRTNTMQNSRTEIKANIIKLNVTFSEEECLLIRLKLINCHESYFVLQCILQYFTVPKSKSKPQLP